MMRMPWRVARGVALGLELLVDLRPKAVHQHDLDAHAAGSAPGPARMCCSLPAAIASPAIADHEGLAAVAWMYGATERNHGTKVCGKDEVQGGRQRGWPAILSSTRLSPTGGAGCRASVPRVELARQPEDDLREDDAERVARRLQADERHRRLEDRRHGDLRRRDALQVEQRIAERRAEERHLHVDDEDDAVPERDVVGLDALRCRTRRRTRARSGSARRSAPSAAGCRPSRGTCRARTGSPSSDSRMP